MTPAPADSSLSFALCLVFILLVPFAVAGIALINAGLGRSRSAAHAMTSSLCAVCVAAMVYFACGFAIQGYRPTMIFGGAHFLLSPVGLFLRGLPWESPASLVFLLGLFSVALCSLIPLGASADRWRLGAACASTIFLAGVTFPVFGLLAWHARVALLNFGSIGFVDVGGSGMIQVTGGLTALSLAWLLGPRRGKYSSNGMPAAIPAHNGVYVLFGCMLAWVGWLGLNSAGAILYAGFPAENSVLVAINTTFSGMAAALTAAALTRVRFRKPDASLIANGWVGGLVASSAGCASLKPATAVLTGFVAGALVVLAIEFLEFTLKIDDPCGSISVHAVAGIWGLLAVGIFSGSGGQLLAQLVGVATLLGFVLPLTYGRNWLLGRFIPYRVSVDGERQGLDLHELGADAYPEFAVHADEFMQR
jgi:ammonium transporter, Amt family